MTLQQLEYILAVDKHRHYMRAAEECHISQSTLSSMILKLETELGVEIFDRTAHPTRPTDIGQKIIDQAKVVLYNARQLEMVPSNEKIRSYGTINIGIIPTIASYIVAKLIKQIQIEHNEIQFHIQELTTTEILSKFKSAEIDMAVMSTPLEKSDLLEIPIYYEKFVIYTSPNDPMHQKIKISPQDLSLTNLWMLKEGHCFRNQVFNFCEQTTQYTSIYDAGNIHTLVQIVDKNGGYTLLPELHIEMLTDAQKANVRRLTDPEPVREVSLVVRNDFIQERILNDVAATIKHVIPESMIDGRLKKFAIKL